MELINEGPDPADMLARHMRQFREARELSLRGLASALTYQYGYLGRVERREQVPSEALCAALDRFFGTVDLFRDLLEMAQDTSTRDYGEGIFRNEPRAERIQVFTSSLIPGLFQTEEYARTLFRATAPWEADEEIERRVTARMRRKRIFEREEPPFFWAIVDEAGLKRPVGGSRCMREQLASILRECQPQHVTVQVLPFGQGVHPMMGGSMSLLTLPTGSSLAYTESFSSGESADSPREVFKLTQRFDVVRAKALPEAESLDLIRTYLKDYEDAADS
ncbi:helix-turn-helix domain-containing protein [Streptomyces johnsoniae]|uniref:Helix-turn-helix transcriptional regulator n=1 Tax=Streptomyces johnsoniae TaxID=3075532 RepID=A0ABU2RXW7_9ACTN|nr:helix-turn-helix transcriptional regulator [Streptomyces sp. DSM 41886]MDT0441602.1 helix-turn-helix transcriptional regulator [Streptomyces sp. DSM 41886]